MFNFSLNANRLFHLLPLLIVFLAGLIISSPASAKRSPEEAFHYQKHMAQAGYSSAIYKLGVMYQNGYGTKRNLAKALELYEESFKLGYKQAESRIGEIKLMLESGDFGTSPAVKVKKKPASKPAKKPAKKSNESAQLKAEREKLRKERAALERSKQKTERARQLEQRKLQEELRVLRTEKEQFEKEKRILKEKRRIKAQKQLEKWRAEASAMEDSE